MGQLDPRRTPCQTYHQKGRRMMLIAIAWQLPRPRIQALCVAWLRHCPVSSSALAEHRHNTTKAGTNSHELQMIWSNRIAAEADLHSRGERTRICDCTASSYRFEPYILRLAQRLASSAGQMLLAIVQFHQQRQFVASVARHLPSNTLYRRKDLYHVRKHRLKIL